MTNAYITNLNIVQAVLNIFDFFCFIGVFSIPNSVGNKSGYLLLCALSGCVGFCAYGLMLNCYSQTIDSSKRRQSDLQILLYGMYFLSTLCCQGYVFYWMVMIAHPCPLELLAIIQNKAFLLLSLFINFAVMVIYFYTAVETLNYVSGFPNGYGEPEPIEGSKSKIVIVMVK